MIKSKKKSSCLWALPTGTMPMLPAPSSMTVCEQAGCKFSSHTPPTTSKDPKDPIVDPKTGGLLWFSYGVYVSNSKGSRPPPGTA